MPDEERRRPYLIRPAGERATDDPFPYQVRCTNQSVEADWDALCATLANNARRCFDHLATTPHARPTDTGRVTPLKGRYTGSYQYEVGAAARVWYRVDQEHMVVVVHRVSIGHPKETE